MIKIICVGCGFPVTLDDAYEEYDGAVRCWGCHSLLQVTISDGKLKAMALGAAERSASAAAGGRGSGTVGRAR